MILSSVRCKATGGDVTKFTNHLLNTNDNESVAVFDLYGNKVSFTDMRDRIGEWLGSARANKDKYAIRQFMINSNEPLSRTQILDFVDRINDEYGIDGVNHHTHIVAHKKPKEGGGFDQHYHVIQNERGFVNRKLICSKFTKMREEKLARVFEFENNHKITASPHLLKIFDQLKKDGYEKLQELKKSFISAGAKFAGGKKRGAAYTHEVSQKAKRSGDQKAFKAAVSTARKVYAEYRDHPETTLQEQFKKAGISLKPGKRAKWVLETDDGIVLGSAAKALKTKNKTFESALRESIENSKEFVQEQQKAKIIEREFINKPVDFPERLPEPEPEPEYSGPRFG